MGWLLLYDEIRKKTQSASIEQKYSILHQCTKMKGIAKQIRYNDVYREFQRLEFVMSEALDIKPYQAKDFFKKRNSGFDIEVLSTVRNNVGLRDFLINFFNLYKDASMETLDLNTGTFGGDKFLDICNNIDESLGVTKHNQQGRVP